MPKNKMHYKDEEKYKKVRNAQRKRYYRKTANKYPIRPWTAYEDRKVLEHSITDTELSALIERSVATIQTRRCRLKKETNIE